MVEQKTVIFIGSKSTLELFLESKTFQLLKLNNFWKIQTMLKEMWCSTSIQEKQQSGNSSFKPSHKQMLQNTNGIYSILLK